MAFIDSAEDVFVSSASLQNGENRIDGAEAVKRTYVECPGTKSLMLNLEAKW